MDEVIKRELDKCIKCGICTASCPVVRGSQKFAGPKHLGPELTRFRLDERLELDEQADYCCDCRSCEQACPAGVKVSLLNAGYRHRLRLQMRGKWGDGLLCRPERLGRMSSVSPELTNLLLRSRLVRAAMEKTLGVAEKRRLPVYSRKSFMKWFQQGERHRSDRKVVYFVGCFANYNAPQTGVSVVNILEHHGFQVLVPELECCGLPLAANGYLEEARTLAEQNLKHLLPYVREGLPVIVSCTSCSLSLKSEYNDYYGLAGAEELGAAVYDFGEFLWEQHARGLLETGFKETKLRLAYHAPCHLKAQGIGRPSWELLRLIPGLEVVEVDEGCCGLSGSYGLKKEKYAISMNIGEQLFTRVREIEPDLVATECGSCSLQIEQGTGCQALHPALLLARAYGFSCPEAL